MTAFILIAIVLIALALMFTVPALLKKNQPITDDFDQQNVSIARERLKEIQQQRESGEINEATFQQLHDELEMTLAQDLSYQSEQSDAAPPASRVMPIAAGIVVPCLAILMYWQLGDFNAATGQAAKSATIPAGENRPQMTIEEAIGKLQQRLREEPDNAEGWFMLAKTYMAVQQYAQAVSAYEKTIELVGEDPELLLRYADALAMTEGGRLTGRAKPVIDKVRQLLPDSPTVLWMAGTAESQQGNYAEALKMFYPLRNMLQSEPQAMAQLEQLIAQAESQLPADRLAELRAEAPAAVTPSAEQGIQAEIVVSVELDPSMKDRVSDGDTLFIFAKAIDGPPMPLAAVKQTVAALPLTVTLTDAMAMMPQMKLSSFEQVTVSAVISKSGQPGAQPGDLYAQVSPVSTQTGEKISLLINQVK